MSEYEPYDHLESTRFYPKRENDGMEIEESLADTLQYQPLKPPYKMQEEEEEEDIDPTVYYGSTDEEEEEEISHQNNIITFQKPRKEDKKEENGIDRLSIAWNQALYLLDQDKINEAYRLILLTHDDFYLLRLMAKTGVCYERLDFSVKNGLFERVCELKKSEFINDLVDEFEREGNRGRKKGESVHFSFSNNEKNITETTDFGEARDVLLGLKGRIGYVHPPQRNLDNIKI